MVRANNFANDYRRFLNYFTGSDGMSLEFKNKYGTVSIQEDIVVYITGAAVKECDKVVGLAARNMKDGLVRLLKNDKLSRGVKIRFEENTLNIDVHVVVRYGSKIMEVADFIIGRVKYRVEEFTGLVVNKVNVFVEGLHVN